MNIIKLGTLIDPIEFDQYITEAEKLETVVHKYGKDFNIPDYPCWMEYKNEGNIVGSISFSRHTLQHPILKDMVAKVADILTPIFPDPIPDRIHLIRTVGSIPPHRDEGGRMCCINIGLKNSSSAITKLSNDGIRENFSINNTEYTIEDGVGYLLNTNHFHSVEGDLAIPRYLITYGFGTKFEILKRVIKPV
jgi:hypothetical protein